MTTLRIRMKPTHVTITTYRAGQLPDKQRFTSAIHALHVVRVMRGEGNTIEATVRTRGAVQELVIQARNELAAAIQDVLA